MLVVCDYGEILAADVLSLVPLGGINLHASLLPKYRGAAPVNWAIIKDEKQTGVTTMKIVGELDAGPVLLQRATRIEDGETAPQLLVRLADIGASLIGETLRDLKEIGPKPQLASEATFAPILKREDGLINWSMEAFAIERRPDLHPQPCHLVRIGAMRRLIEHPFICPVACRGGSMPRGATIATAR